MNDTWLKHSGLILIISIKPKFTKQTLTLTVQTCETVKEDALKVVLIKNKLIC